MAGADFIRQDGGTRQIVEFSGLHNRVNARHAGGRQVKFNHTDGGANSGSGPLLDGSPSPGTRAGIGWWQPASPGSVAGWTGVPGSVEMYGMVG